MKPIKMRRTNQRMLWLLKRIKENQGYAIAWDSDLVDAFVKEFPESEKNLIYYTQGANSCPMLNRAAQRAKRLLFLEAYSGGTDGAHSYHQRTWHRSWKLTDAGKDYISFVDGMVA